MLDRPLLLFVLFLCVPLLAQAQAQQRPAPTAAARTQADTNYSFVRYRADYEVRADASSVETDEYGSCSRQSRRWSSSVRSD